MFVYGDLYDYVIIIYLVKFAKFLCIYFREVMQLASELLQGSSQWLINERDWSILVYPY